MSNYEVSSFNYPKDDLKSIFTDLSDRYRPCTISEMFEISSILKLPYISRILYFSVAPDRYHPIHIDKTVGSIYSVDFALNIPITDCNKIYMNWFENLSNNSSTYYPYDKTQATPILEYKNAKTIDTANLNLPMFVKINDWHNIENRSADNVEKLISIRFFQKITIADVKKALGLS